MRKALQDTKRVAWILLRKAELDGKLKLVNYGRLNAMQIDPIEKKPFNHFMPGSYVFGIGTSSCNWGCLFCQNHNISKDREMKAWT